MAGAKTKATTHSVQAYIDAIENSARRKDCMELMSIAQEITGQPPVMWGNSIIGFASFHYKYASGHEGDTFLIGLSARKNNISIYLGADVLNDETRLKQLGKVKAGKGCLYITSLDQVNRQVLRHLFVDSVSKTRERLGE